MTAITPSASAPTRVPDASPSRAIALHRDVLLASDGSPAAFAATRFLAALSARLPLTPHVLTVVPLPSATVDPVGAGIAFGASLEAELGSEVQHQLERCSAGAWSHEIGAGLASTEIVRAAERLGSELIVLGLRPHALLDRVFRDETALSVMRYAKAPVLAVTPLLQRAPRRIAVAIDFSRASVTAARVALTLLDDDGVLELVYVEPASEPRSDETEGYATIYAQGVAAAFSRLRQELASRSNVTIETVVLHGAVAPELLSFVERADIDVLAVGSQRHSIARRAFVGGVTTALTRAAACSLLVIPPGRRV